MMRRLAMAVAVLSAAGCATSGVRITEVSTTPPGALVRVEGFGECESPCRISIDRPRQLTIAKAGFKAERLEIRPGQKRVEVALQLAAPTEDVDQSILPDL